jgi:hypothetical protein
MGDAAKVVRLIEAGAAADMPLAGGETLLMRAAARGHADVARALLDGGAEVNARRLDGFTPLLVAVFRGHEEVVRLLLERGADASARTRLGATAGGWAASHGFAEIAELLKAAAPEGGRDDARVVSSSAVAYAAVVDERRAPENVKEVGAEAGRARGVVEGVRGAARVEETAAVRATFLSSVLSAGAVGVADDEDDAAVRADAVGQSSHEAPARQPTELFASFGARRSAEAARYRVALVVVLALVAAVAGAALYALTWQAKPAAGGQTHIAPAGGAVNNTPRAQPSAPPAQPSPGASPPVVTGAPVIVNAPADAAPVGAGVAAGQSAVGGSSSPVVVVEGGPQKTEAKSPRAGATNAAGGQAADAAKKEEARGGDERAGEQPPTELDGDRLPPGAVMGRNDWGNHAWGGPNPPIGRHRYFFKVYALDIALHAPNAMRDDFHASIKGHVLAQGELIGTYEKPHDRRSLEKTGAERRPSSHR